MTDRFECKHCAHYIGDCRHHFINSLGHIEYNAPRESEYDGRFSCDGPACWEPNEEIISADRQRKIANIICESKGDVELLNAAIAKLQTIQEGSR